jgi:hypothetical protein
MFQKNKLVMDIFISGKQICKLLGLEDSGVLHSEGLVFFCCVILENKVTSLVTIYSRRPGPSKNLERSKHVHFSKGF